MSPNMDHLERAILNAMQEETNRIIEEESKNAAKRVEERVRGMAGEIATRVASWVSYESMRNELRITVSLPPK